MEKDLRFRRQAVGGVLIALLLGLGGCAQDAAEVPAGEPTELVSEALPPAEQEPAALESFRLPLPDGWTAETIPFPISFAPDLPYRGVEEIRFAPGWSDPEAPDFWTYLFVWAIEDPGVLEVATLEEQLEQYFRGLASSGGVEAGDRVVADLERVGDRIQGTVDIVDSFNTREEIELNLEVDREVCAEGGLELWRFAWSPQPTDHAVWQGLRQLSEEVACVS